MRQVSQARSKRFRRARASELRQLQGILREYALTDDVSPVSGAAAGCEHSEPGGRGTWGYDAHGLTLYLDPKRYAARLGGQAGPPAPTHQHLATVVAERVILGVQLRGMCDDAAAGNDPLLSLLVQLDVDGKDRDGTTYRSAWHLDSDPPLGAAAPSASVPGASSAYIHPRYHMQFGGHRLWQLALMQPGHILVLDSPRIAHPPLDAVLAVDFVVTNYAPCIAKVLRDDPTYCRLVLESQLRFWKPYAMATAAHWTSSQGCRDTTGQMMWPHCHLPGIPQNLVDE